MLAIIIVTLVLIVFFFDSFFLITIQTYPDLYSVVIIGR